MKFITGLVYKINTEIREQRNIEAVSIYDTDTRDSTLTSMDKLKQMLLDGIVVNGASIKVKPLFDEKRQDYKCVNQLILNKKSYNYRRLAILDGSGKLLEKGIETIIGKLKGSESEYLVVDAENKISVVHKDRISLKNYNGVSFYYKVCRNSQQELEL